MSAMGFERRKLLEQLIAKTGERHWSRQPNADPTGTAELLGELAGELLAAQPTDAQLAALRERWSSLHTRLAKGPGYTEGLPEIIPGPELDEQPDPIDTPGVHHGDPSREPVADFGSGPREPGCTTCGAPHGHRSGCPDASEPGGGQ